MSAADIDLDALAGHATAEHVVTLALGGTPLRCYTADLTQAPGLREGQAYAGISGVVNGEHVVVIDRALAGPVRATTWLHEFLHAVSEALHVGLTERQVRALEVGLGQVLTGSPSFTRALVRDLVGPPGRGRS